MSATSPVRPRLGQFSDLLTEVKSCHLKNTNRAKTKNNRNIAEAVIVELPHHEAKKKPNRNSGENHHRIEFSDQTHDQLIFIIIYNSVCM